jgi:hypothetical protein
MRSAILLCSLIFLSGCGSIEAHLKSQKDANCASGEKAQQKPTLLQRLGFGDPPAKKLELSPPIPIDRSNQDAFEPAMAPEIAPFVRPGSLAIEEAVPLRGDGDDAGE